MTGTRPVGIRIRDWWHREVVGAIDRAAIMATVAEDAGWSLRYAFMIVLSAGIAVLGLLQSSPAVIIGAMLISPLMGPIIGLGFALAVFDWRDVRRSLAALAAGSLLAVGFTALVVSVSPLQAVTSEILARTRPNLFDLLIAIFSALAGAYATIRGKGATIVGVAIATALMPPLATVGFGLATGSAPIAGGALALFFTNLLAIALCAAIMARLFGFGTSLSPQQSRQQAIGIILVFVLMAIPLGLSLRRIAWESLATRQLRTAIESYFPGHAQLSQFDVDFARQPVTATAVVLTETYRPEAPAAATAAARRILGADAEITVEQLIINRDTSEIASERSALAQAEASRSGADEAAKIAVALAALANREPAETLVDTSNRRAAVIARAPANLNRLMAGEAAITARHPGWQITVLPPAGTPLTIPFAPDSADLDPAALETALWALKRWDTAAVRATGHAASRDDGRDPAALALNRATAVADLLTAKGLTATPEGDPPGPRQRAAEAENGVAAFRSVSLQPVVP
jgi:uncharacterized hydrophobic protein (TIGR00271 family)